MKKQKIFLNFKNKKFEIFVEKCNLFGMIKGLMFSRREKANALLFEFDKKIKISIHSLFVFYPFLAIWVDKKNKVLEIKKVFPFSLGVFPKFKCEKLIEIPINKKYRDKIVKFIDYATVRKI